VHGSSRSGVVGAGSARRGEQLYDRLGESSGDLLSTARVQRRAREVNVGHAHHLAAGLRKSETMRHPTDNLTYPSGAPTHRQQLIAAGRIKATAGTLG